MIELTLLDWGNWRELEIKPHKDLISKKIKFNGNQEGNYIIFINGKLRYIGESKYLKKRLKQHMDNIRMYFPESVRVVFKIRLLQQHENRKEIEDKLLLRFNPSGNKKIKDTPDIQQLEKAMNYLIT